MKERQRQKKRCEDFYFSITETIMKSERDKVAKMGGVVKGGEVENVCRWGNK